MARWALAIFVWPLLAQLPPSGTLSERDLPLFRAEVDRVEALLKSAPDRAAVTYQMARTWASAEQWPEAIEWLRKVDLNAGFDPLRDAVFTPLRGAQEFRTIVSAMRQSTAPVSHSSLAFRIDEAGLMPESLAWDPKSKLFFFGSMSKGKVVRCGRAGECWDFASGLGTVLGLKVHGASLWVVSDSERESSLVSFDLASGRVRRAYPVGPGHVLNDLAISRSGDVYVTDTRTAGVWHLAKGAARLERMDGDFPAANGIALSDDGCLLYVSTFPNGITVVDLKTRRAAPIVRHGDLCLAYIDGLYFFHGALIAIQNSFISPRVVRLGLSRDLRAVEKFEIPERRNPLFDGVTTGVVANDDFFYMANIQDGRKSGFEPIAILKLRLR